MYSTYHSSQVLYFVEDCIPLPSFSSINPTLLNLATMSKANNFFTDYSFRVQFCSLKESASNFCLLYEVSLLITLPFCSIDLGDKICPVVMAVNCLYDTL